MRNLIILLALISPTFAINFNCTFSYVSHSVINSKYTCTATPYEFEKNRTLEVVNGVHSTGKNISHVEGVYIRNCVHFDYIPEGISQLFPNMIALTLYQCGLTTLYGYELEEYPKLEYFSAFNNKIVRIDGNLFRPTKRMRFVGFESNQLKSVGTNLLERLLFLEYGYFSNNLCINTYASSSSAVPCLVGQLRVYCPDVDEKEEFKNSTKIQPKVEDSCNSKEQNDLILLQTLELSLSVEKLSFDVGAIKELLEKMIDYDYALRN